MNPVHELRTREILRQELPDDVDITLSHEVLPQMLEFERTCTTVLNAYVSPILKNYLKGLADRLKADWSYDGTILVTTSSGGVIGMDEALKLPARTFHSSPVSGAVGLAGYIGSLAGFENVIAFETGGTTNNVSIIYRGKPAITHEWKILWNVPCCLPSVDTVYIGAGGGSIGWVDKGGILNVGPAEHGSGAGPRLLRCAAAPNRPIPTPRSCSAASIQTIISAARFRSMPSCRGRRSKTKSATTTPGTPKPRRPICTWSP